MQPTRRSQPLPATAVEGARLGEAVADDAYFTKEENILVTWPTKLTLAPALSDQVLADLHKDKIIPSSAAPEITLEAILKPAVIGAPEWHRGTTA